MMFDTLAERLRASDPEERRLAVSELGLLGIDAIPLLIKALGDDEWRVRKEATQVILQLPPSRELAIAVAQAFLPNENVGLRNAAVEALAALGHWAVEAIDGVLGRLDADGRKLAAEALGLCRQPSAAGLLKTLANDDDQNVRIAALESLGHTGTTGTHDAEPVLKAALHAFDAIERLSALQSLNELGVTLSWLDVAHLAADPLLQRALWNLAARLSDGISAAFVAEAATSCRESEFPWAIAAIAARISRDAPALVRMRPALANLTAERQDWLRQLLASDLLEQRQAALITLVAVGRADAVQLAFDALDDDSMAGTAERALAMMPAESLALLKQQAANVDSPRSQALAIGMMARLTNVQIGSELTSAICTALTSDDASVLLAVFECLEQSSNEECLEAVFVNFEHAADHVETSAIKALQTMARRHKSCAEHLCATAKASDPGVLAAVVTMAALVEGCQDRDLARTEFIGRALTHELPRVRRVALEALVSCGHAKSNDIAMFALTDEEPQVRRAAIRALGQSSDSAAIERLIEIVHSSEDADMVVSAIRALGEIDSPKSLQVLRPVARAGSPVLAVAAVEAIASLGDSRRVDSLIDSLSHTDAEVVKAALQMLASESDLRANAHLGACLDHEAWDVRRLAADLLGRIGGDNAIALLRAKLAMEQEPLVREAITRALGDADNGNYAHRNTPCFELGSWRPK